MTDLSHDPAPQHPVGRTSRPFIRAAGLPILALLVLLGLPGTVLGQSTTVDAGTFLLSRNGQAIGTETFSIRRTGPRSNANYVATGEVDIQVDGEDRLISVALEASADAAVVSAYQLKEGGNRRTEIYLTRADRRFQARIVTPEGEQVREYRAVPSVVLLERWVAHHYYFIAQRVTGAQGRAPALVPRTGEQLDLRIRSTGTERIQVAGEGVQAQRLRLENGAVSRDVWVDDQGRVLLVVNHDTGFRAERKDLPS